MATTPTTTVLSEGEAAAFVAEWMAAWNSRDVERILEHYADDVEYFSPFIAALAEPGGPGADGRRPQRGLGPGEERTPGRRPQRGLGPGEERTPGRLVGKDAVRVYFAAALEKYSELHFEPPWHVAAGAGSVSFVYGSVNDLTAVETLVFRPGTRIVARAHCHYSAGTGGR